MDGDVLLTQGQNALSSEKLYDRPQQGHGPARGPGADDLRAGTRRQLPAPDEAPRRPDLAAGRERHRASRSSNLAKSYKGRPVLRDVSLGLRRGEVAALLGPNGAGKTTCFYAIAGLVPPDRGTILVDGRT